MVICFEASSEAHAALKQIMASGRYRDLNAAVSSAICNLAVLDVAVAAAGGLMIQKESSASIAEEPHVEVPRPVAASSLSAHLKRPVPPLDTARFETDGPVSVTSDALLGPKDWPWGQFNKLLPVKVSCRATLNLLLQNPMIKASDAAEAVASAAFSLATVLRQADVASHRRRDEAFAAAFPSSKLGDDKSRQRFMEQFVFATGSFATSSFPQLLGFLRLEGASVRLTRAGREFGECANPLLDGNLLQSAEKFSTEELEFLRRHIRGTVPSERSALTAVLRAVRDGAKNPDAVDTYLRQLFPEAASDLTEPFLATQRTGAISRAVELKLLRRDRQGIRVSYVLEQPGEAFLQP